jgi:hypothetical protein
MPSDFLDADNSASRTMRFFMSIRLHNPKMASDIMKVNGEVYLTGLKSANHAPSSPEKIRLPTDGIMNTKENVQSTAAHAARGGGFATWSRQYAPNR